MDMYAPPAPEDNDQIQGYPPPFQPHQANQVMTTHGVSVPSYQVVVLQSQESARAVSSNSQEAGASEVSPEKEASMANALILAIGLGMFGAHHFYLRRYRFGVVYLCTLGLLGCGYIIDWFRVPCLVKDYNQKIRNNQPEVGIEERSVSDTYVLWFPMGLLGEVLIWVWHFKFSVWLICAISIYEGLSVAGFHHYYLRRWGWALLYTFTIGLFGIGWLVDLFRIPFLVRKCNNKILMQERLQERMPFRWENHIWILYNTCSQSFHNLQIQCLTCHSCIFLQDHKVDQYLFDGCTSHWTFWEPPLLHGEPKVGFIVHFHSGSMWIWLACWLG